MVNGGHHLTKRKRLLGACRRSAVPCAPVRDDLASRPWVCRGDDAVSHGSSRGTVSSKFRPRPCCATTNGGGAHLAPEATGIALPLPGPPQALDADSDDGLAGMLLPRARPRQRPPTPTAAATRAPTDRCRAAVWHEVRAAARGAGGGRGRERVGQARERVRWREMWSGRWVGWGREGGGGSVYIPLHPSHPPSRVQRPLLP